MATRISSQDECDEFTKSRADSTGLPEEEEDTKDDDAAAANVHCCLNVVVGCILG